MCDYNSNFWSAVIPAIFGFLGALLGGAVTYFVAEKARRRKLLHEIADDFSNQIGEWSRRSFQPCPEFIDWHRASVNRLSPHIHYLERRRNDLFQQIRSDWLKFSGGDKAIEMGSYLGTDKNFWMTPLYNIFDALMEY